MGSFGEMLAEGIEFGGDPTNEQLNKKLDKIESLISKEARQEVYNYLTDGGKNKLKASAGQLVAINRMIEFYEKQLQPLLEGQQSSNTSNSSLETQGNVINEEPTKDMAKEEKQPEESVKKEKQDTEENKSTTKKGSKKNTKRGNKKAVKTSEIPKTKKEDFEEEPKLEDLPTDDDLNKLLNDDTEEDFLDFNKNQKLETVTEELNNSNYDFTKDSSMTNPVMVNLYIKSLAFQSGYNVNNYKDFVKNITEEDFLNFFIINENDTEEIKNKKNTLQKIIIETYNTNGITKKTSKEKILKYAIGNIYNRIKSSKSITTVSINFEGKIKENTFEEYDFIFEEEFNKPKEEVIENGNQYLVNGKYRNSWFANMPIIDYVNNISNTLGISIEVQLLSDINGMSVDVIHKFNNVDDITNTVIGNLSKVLLKTNRIFLLPFSDKNTMPVLKFNSKEDLLTFEHFINEIYNTYNDLFRFDNEMLNNIQKLLPENVNAKTIAEAYNSKNLQYINQFEKRDEIFDLIYSHKKPYQNEIDEQGNIIKDAQYVINSLVSRFLIEEIKYGNKKWLETKELQYTALKNTNATKIFKRQVPVVSMWNSPINEDKLKEMRKEGLIGSENDSAYYDSNTNEIMIKVSILSAEDMEGEDKELFYDKNGKFIFDGCTFQLSNIKSIININNRSLNEGAQKNYIIFKNLFFKHSMQLINSKNKKSGRLLELMQNNKIGLLAFNSNEKLGNKSKRQDENGNIYYQSEVNAYDVNNNPISLRDKEHKVTSWNDFKNGKVNTFYIPLSSIHRIGETHTNETETNGVQQSIFSSGICSANPAISGKTIDLLNEFVTNIGKKFGTKLNEKSNEYPDLTNMEVEFAKYAQRIIKKPASTLQHLSFSNFYKHLEDKSIPEIYEVIFNMKNHMLTINVMRDFLGEKLLSTVKLRHEGSMSTLLPDGGNLMEERIADDETLQKAGLRRDIVYNEQGRLNKNYCHITSDIAKRLNLKVGDKIIIAIVPTDSGMGLKSVTIANIMDDSLADSNGITLSSEFIMLVGKDYDIDKVVLLRQDDLVLNKSKWDDLCEELNHNWDRYKEKIKQIMNVKTDKEAFSNEGQLKFMQAQLGKTDNSSYIKVFSRDLFKLIGSYYKNVGDIIIIRQLHQILGTVGYQYKNVNVGEKDLWFRNHLMHLILTNWEVDYPNIMSKDLVKYNREILINQMFDNVFESVDEIKELDKNLMNLLQDFMSIPRFTEGENGETRVSAVIRRILENKNVLDSVRQQQNKYYLETLLKEMLPAIPNMPIPYNARPTKYSLHNIYASFSFLINNINDYSYDFETNDVISGLIALLELGEDRFISYEGSTTFENRKRLLGNNFKYETDKQGRKYIEYNINPYDIYDYYTFGQTNKKMAFKKAVDYANLYFEKISKLSNKSGVKKVIGYNSNIIDNKNYKVITFDSIASVDRLDKMSNEEVMNYDYFMVQETYKDGKLDSNTKEIYRNLYNKLAEKYQTNTTAYVDLTWTTILDLIKTINLTPRKIEDLYEVFLKVYNERISSEQKHRFGSPENFFNQMLQKANQYGKNVSGKGYKYDNIRTVDIFSCLLSAYFDQTNLALDLYGENSYKDNIPMLSYKLANFYDWYAQITDYKRASEPAVNTYGHYPRHESSLYNILVQGVNGRLNYGEYVLNPTTKNYEFRREGEYNDLLQEEMELAGTQIASLQTLASYLLVEEFTKHVLDTNNYKIFSNEIIKLPNNVVNELNKKLTKQQNITTDYSLRFNMENNQVELLQHGIVVESVKDINQSDRLKHLFNMKQFYQSIDPIYLWNAFRFHYQYNLTMIDRVNITEKVFNEYIENNSLIDNTLPSVEGKIPVAIKEVYLFANLEHNYELEGTGFSKILTGNNSVILNFIDEKLAKKMQKQYNNTSIDYNSLPKEYIEAVKEDVENGDYSNTISQLNTLIEEIREEDNLQIYELYEGNLDDLDLSKTYNKEKVLYDYYRHLEKVKKQIRLAKNFNEKNKGKFRYKLRKLFFNRIENLIRVYDPKIFGKSTDLSMIDSALTFTFDKNFYNDSENDYYLKSEEVIVGNMVSPISVHEMGERGFGLSRVAYHKVMELEGDFNLFRKDILDILGGRETEKLNTETRPKYYNTFSMIENYLNEVSPDIFNVYQSSDMKEYIFVINGKKYKKTLYNLYEPDKSGKSVIDLVLEIIDNSNLPENLLKDLDSKRLINSILRTKVVYHAILPQMVKKIKLFMESAYNNIANKEANIYLDDMERMLRRIYKLDSLLYVNSIEYENKAELKRRFIPVVIARDLFISQYIVGEKEKRPEATEDELKKEAIEKVGAGAFYIPSLSYNPELNYLYSVSINHAERDSIFIKRVIDFMQNMIMSTYEMQYKLDTQEYEVPNSLKNDMEQLFDKNNNFLRNLTPVTIDKATKKGYVSFYVNEIVDTEEGEQDITKAYTGKLIEKTESEITIDYFGEKKTFNINDIFVYNNKPNKDAEITVEGMSVEFGKIYFTKDKAKSERIYQLVANFLTLNIMGGIYIPKVTLTNLFGSFMSIVSETPMALLSSKTKLKNLKESAIPENKAKYEAIIKSSALGSILLDSLDYISSDTILSESLPITDDWLGRFIEVTKIIKQDDIVKPYFDLLIQKSVELQKILTQIKDLKESKKNASFDEKISINNNIHELFEIYKEKKILLNNIRNKDLDMLVGDEYDIVKKVVDNKAMGAYINVTKEDAEEMKNKMYKTIFRNIQYGLNKKVEEVVRKKATLTAIDLSSDIFDNDPRLISLFATTFNSTNQGIYTFWSKNLFSRIGIGKIIYTLYSYTSFALNRLSMIMEQSKYDAIMYGLMSRRIMGYKFSPDTGEIMVDSNGKPILEIKGRTAQVTLTNLVYINMLMFNLSTMLGGLQFLMHPFLVPIFTSISFLLRSINGDDDDDPKLAEILFGLSQTTSLVVGYGGNLPLSIATGIILNKPTLALPRNPRRIADLFVEDDNKNPFTIRYQNYQDIMRLFSPITLNINTMPLTFSQLVTDTFGDFLIPFYNQWFRLPSANVEDFKEKY